MAGARDEAEIWTLIRETQIRVSKWEEMLEWIAALRKDNGHQGLETRLSTLEAFMKSRKRIEWAALLALIAVVVGAAFNVGSYVAIAGIKATLQQQAHPAGSVNKQQPRESGGG